MVQVEDTHGLGVGKSQQSTARLEEAAWFDPLVDHDRGSMNDWAVALSQIPHHGIREACCVINRKARFSSMVAVVSKPLLLSRGHERWYAGVGRVDVYESTWTILVNGINQDI